MRLDDRRLEARVLERVVARRCTRRGTRRAPPRTRRGTSRCARCAAHRSPRSGRGRPSRSGSPPRAHSTMAPVIKALLFDFDGTLVDTESIDLRAWQEMFEAHGVSVPVDRFALADRNADGSGRARRARRAARRAVRPRRGRRERRGASASCSSWSRCGPASASISTTRASSGWPSASSRAARARGSTATSSGSDCSTAGPPSSRRRRHDALQAEPGALPRGAGELGVEAARGDRDRGLAERRRGRARGGHLLRRLPERRHARGSTSRTPTWCSSRSRTSRSASCSRALADTGRALAELLRAAGRCVALTGAGVSTESGIPGLPFADRDLGAVRPDGVRDDRGVRDATPRRCGASTRCVTAC